MYKFRSFPAGALLLCLTLLLGGCASQPSKQDTDDIVRRSETTLSTFMRDPDMTWLHTHLHEAKGVIVSPGIFQAGFIVGGSGGPGIAMARGRSAQAWNGPAFYTIGTGSVGLQAGAQEAEMVILVMNQKAVDSLLSTSFKLGGDVSIAAGPIGAGAGRVVTADMVVFTRTKGIYGGINLTGTVISVDDKRNGAFYAQPATPVDILAEGRVHSPTATSLTQSLNRYDTAAP